MVKFQRIVDVVLIFYSYLLTKSVISQDPTKEPKNIHAEDSSELRLVNLVFRHGDRTLDKSINESYPNDPYKDMDLYPYGEGQLTNVGKKRSYELGLLLRDKYNEFLGDVYHPSEVYAQSTFITRSKMTLQLVLAALYPPVEIQKWNSKLSWQPIDLIYSPVQEDNLLFPFLCPTFTKIFRSVLRKPEVKEKIEKFNGLKEIVSKNAGLNITEIMEFLSLYNVLYTQSVAGLPLPEWAKEVLSNGELADASSLVFELLSYDQLNDLNGGVLLNQIVEDMNGVMAGTLNRKINLFSAHDTTVSAMLYALKLKPCLPAFTSSIIIELHKKNETYFVKVLHYLGIPPNILEVSIPGCEILCPYNKFLELTNSTRTFKQQCRPMTAKPDISYVKDTIFKYNEPPKN